MLNTDTPKKTKKAPAKVTKPKSGKKPRAAKAAKVKAEPKSEAAHPRATPLINRILAVNPSWSIFSIKKDGSVIFDTNVKGKTAVLVQFPIETLSTIDKLLAEATNSFTKDLEEKTLAIAERDRTIAQLKDQKAKEPAATSVPAMPKVTKKIILPPKADVPRLAMIFDTETTGLVENRTIALDKQPEVIEFYGAMVDLDTGKVVRDFDTLIKPKKLPLPEQIIKITGINDDMLKGELPFVNHYYDIEKMIREADVVIAHNLKFDADMLEIEFERLGRTLNWPKKICTVEATMPMKGFRLNLGRLHKELFGEEFAGAHRAKADVEALIRCCVELRKRGVV